MYSIFWATSACWSHAPLKCLCVSNILSLICLRQVMKITIINYFPHNFFVFISIIYLHKFFCHLIFLHDGFVNKFCWSSRWVIELVKIPLIHILVPTFFTIWRLIELRYWFKTCFFFANHFRNFNNAICKR